MPRCTAFLHKSVERSLTSKRLTIVSSVMFMHAIRVCIQLCGRPSAFGKHTLECLDILNISLMENLHAQCRGSSLPSSGTVQEAAQQALAMAERHRMQASGELDGEDLLCCNTALLANQREQWIQATAQLFSAHHLLTEVPGRCWLLKEMQTVRVRHH